VITIFGLSYAVTNLGLSRNLVLGAIALGALGELITIPLFGHLSDRMGRRSIYLLGCIAAILLSFPIFGGSGPRPGDCDSVLCNRNVGRTRHRVWRPCQLSQ
jgi:MFS family permease